MWELLGANVLKMGFFATFVYLQDLARKLASPFGHTTPSFYVSLTCVHWRLLASPPGQDLTFAEGLVFMSLAGSRHFSMIRRMIELTDEKYF